MAAAPPLPALFVSGPDSPLLRHVTVQLRTLGYVPEEGATPAAASSAEPPVSIAVICPASNDREWLQALQTILTHDTTPGRTAYVFVVPGSMERWRGALESVRGRRFFGLLEGSATTEVLARQLDLASRWLETVPARLTPHQPEILPALSPVG